jgi:hypothetical protein
MFISFLDGTRLALKIIRRMKNDARLERALRSYFYDDFYESRESEYKVVVRYPGYESYHDIRNPYNHDGAWHKSYAVALMEATDLWYSDKPGMHVGKRDMFLYAVVEIVCSDGKIIKTFSHKR